MKRKIAFVFCLLFPFALLGFGANAVNRLSSYAGGAVRVYQIADVDASKDNGATAGDWCYAVNTGKLYIWTSGGAWVSR